jgi:flagellar basal-body rod protein FlgG
MFKGLYTGCAGMLSQIMNQAIIAHNLANVAHTGYKKKIGITKETPQIFHYRFEDAQVVPQEPRFRITPGRLQGIGCLGTGAQVVEAATIYTQGPLQETGGKLDLAIEGAGFFTIQSPVGEELYTRNGSFTLNEEGFLVTQSGYLVLGERGPIRLDVPDFSIKEDGTILANPKVQPEGWRGPQEIDRLRIVTFENLGGLLKRGDNLFVATDASGPPRRVGPPASRVLQGFLEKSNVNVIEEMVNMINVQRAYEASQRVIRAHDELTGRIIAVGGAA